MPQPQATFPHTKLIPPQPSRDVLVRPELIQRLQTMVDQHPFILISAPAGAGKTTLVTSWMTAKPDQRVSWLHLEAADNDPATFLAVILAALQRAVPGLGEGVQPLIAELQQPDGGIIRLINLLINELMSGSAEPFVLVLDDFHELVHPAVIEGIEHLIHHLPPMLKVVATSRTDPSFALARLKVRDHLGEIRLDELRFDRNEIEIWFQESLGLNLPDSLLINLERQTEGWVAGLKILAHALNRLSTNGEREAYLARLSVLDRRLFDFLAEEVFYQQSQELQQFLLACAVLDELTPASCEAVTKQDNAAILLDDLFRRNLFLAGIHGRTGEVAYRFHQLFLDFLRLLQKRRLSPEQIRTYHGRAARAATLDDEAIDHWIAGQFWEEAAAHIVQVGLRELERGVIRQQIKRWIDLLPTFVVNDRPTLSFLLGVIAYRSGYMPEARTHLTLCLPYFEQSNEPSKYHWALFYLAGALLELEGPQAQLNIMERLDIGQLPLSQQVLAHLVFSWSYMPLYRWEKVNFHLERMFNLVFNQGNEHAYILLSQHLGINLYFSSLGLAPFKRFCAEAKKKFGRNPIIQMGVALHEGTIAILEGRLSEAAAFAGLATHISEQLGGFGYVDQNIGFVWGGIALITDDHRAAEAGLAQSLKHADERGQFRAALAGMAYGNGRIGWLQQNRQKVKEMLVLIDSIDHRLQRLEADGIRCLLNGYLADLEGQPAAAEDLLREAIRLQNRYEHTAISGSATFVLAELYFKWHRISEALRIIRPEIAKWKTKAMPGVVMMQGSSLIPLLEAAQREKIEPEFIKKVLMLHPTHQKKERPIMIDETGAKLTPREVEVLRLLADGASNQAIAEQLVISLRTVKAHVSNILTKFNVSSRLEAAAKGRPYLD